MLDFLKLKQENFGLDISDLSLKIAYLENKRGKINLSSFGETPVKQGIIDNGEVKDKKSFSRAIKKAVGTAKGKEIKTKYVAVSLPEEKSFVQVIKMPRLAKEDLKSAVIYEAESHIPFSIEDVYLDSQVIPSASGLGHYNVLIAAFPKKSADPYLESIEMAGLKPVFLEVESLSVSRALIKDGIADFPLLIIDLGATGSGFTVFSGRSLRFTSSISVSAEKFTEAISKTLNVKKEKAEKLKIKNGLLRKGREGKEIFEALIPSFTDLIEQIKKYIEYYQSHDFYEEKKGEGKKIKKVLLCGGGANLKGFAPFLSEQLGISVELADPWINIGKIDKEKNLVPGNPLGYVTAFGLALRNIKK